MCHNILKYCLREALGERQRRTLFRFLDSLRDLVNEEQDIGQLDAIETELNFTLALMERDFPITIQVKFHSSINLRGNIKNNIPAGNNDAYSTSYCGWYQIQRARVWYMDVPI